MMIVVAISALVVLGMLAGRAFGGWLSLDRAFRLFLFLPAVWPAWIVYTLAPDTIWWLPSMSQTFWPGSDERIWGAGFALLTTALLIVHLVDGHRYDDPWLVTLRYGWAPLVLAFLTGVWPIVLAGPLIGIAAFLAKMLNLPPLWLPWDEKPVFASSPITGGGGFIHTSRPGQQMLDGWAAYWEMAKGAITMLAFAWPAFAVLIR